MLSILDRLIIGFDNLINQPTITTLNPAHNIDDNYMEASDYQKSTRLMRINHSGEVCAQALYHAQALFAHDQQQYDDLMHAATEELVHLTWCRQRLEELNSSPSLLTPLWFSGSYLIGVVASLAGDQYSNAFINETELQVGAHLADHIDKLPTDDLRSRAILEQMQADELRHAAQARKRGMRELPSFIKVSMHYSAKIFKQIAARI